MGWAESIGLRLLGWELGLRPVLKNGSRAFCCKLKKRSREEQKKLAENSTLEEEDSEGMWAATVSFPCYAHQKPIHMSIRADSKPLKLQVRASFFDYPLASKILVKNIPYSTSENSLQQKFSSFGQIAEVKLVKDESSRRSKGFAFIQYTSQDDAMLALENMDRQNLDGRIIYVELARPGKDAYGEYPRTSGPPKKQNLPQQEEVSDCWY